MRDGKDPINKIYIISMLLLFSFIIFTLYKLNIMMTLLLK